MNEKIKLWLAFMFSTLGIAGTIISSFNIKYDPAWISILVISVVFSALGIKAIDNFIGNIN